MRKPSPEVLQSSENWHDFESLGDPNFGGYLSVTHEHLDPPVVGKGNLSRNPFLYTLTG